MANNNETTIENPFNTGDVNKKKEKSPQPQPNYAELVEVGNAQPDYAELVEVKKGVGGQIKDLGVSLAAGGASLPDLAIGIGDLYSGGRAGKAIEDSGIYTPGSGRDYWRDKKTINSKSQGQQFDAAEGIIEKTKVALTNPSLITNAIGESLAPMAAGGLVGRGINVASKGKIGAAAAGAIGEGVVMGGSQAENIRQETHDGLLTDGQIGAAMATGVAGSAFGYLGGRIAQKLGFDDIDNMMANGVRSDAVQEAAKNIPITSIPKKILQGAISEGILEELPQSVSEQALQNIALGKPWNENLDDAIVMGTLAGMAMGGGINAYTSSKEYLGQERKDEPQESTNPDLPMLPGGNAALEGEFIPGDRGQPTTDAQGRATYEYDQFSTDAENRLEFGNNNNPDAFTGINSENNPTGPDSPLAPNGTYYDAPLVDAPPKPSEQLGINPNDGPMSNAAALAVDSGASAITHEQNQSAALNESQNTQQQMNDAPLNNDAQSVNTDSSTTYSNTTAQAIQHGMGEIAKGAQEAALENTIQRLEKDGEVTLFKKDSIAQALGDENYNVRQNEDGSASIIGVRNPATNEWHGLGNVDAGQTTVLENQKKSDVSNRIISLQQQLEEARTVPEKAKINKEINALQQISTKSQGVNSNDIQTAEGIEHSTSKLPTSARVDSTSTESPSTINAENIQSPPQNPSNLPLKVNNDAVLGEDIRLAQSTDKPSATENIISASENSISNSRNSIFEAQNNIDKIQSKDSEIQTSEDKSNLRSEINNQSQISSLETQLANEKSVIKKVRLRKQIAELQKDNPVDQAAHAAATSIQNDLPEPTQAQIEAGNYKKGHIKVHGLDIAVENPRGSERRGTDPDGNEWSHTMSDHYGYIKRTTGADQENIDTYVGKNHDSDKVFVVDQIDQGTNGFDEHKVMLGFDSQEEAVAAYQSNFDNGWKVGAVNEMTRDQFKEWLKNSDTTKPAATKNLKDSIENIRAEKIRQKNINDLHGGVYGNASMQELENSLNLLSKRIQKNHELSIGEVTNGKRSTRKAVASGAVDNFRKQKMDLEAYIKARKSGEVKQKKTDQNDKNEGKDINDFSRDRLDPDEKRKGISPIETTFNPLSITGATRRVLSVLQHLKLPTTQDMSISGRINIGRISLKSSFSVQVVSSFDGLPSEIQNDATYQDENGKTQNYDVSGVWHDGTLYVVADQVYGDSTKQLTTFDAYEELLAHEIIGHFGVQQIFGSEYKSKLQQLFNALGGLDGIRKIAKKNGVDMPQFESSYIQPYTQGAKDKIYSESDVQQALVGELFAFIAQNQSKQPFVRQKIKEVIGFIRQWFRERGFDKFLSRYNDTDLMMFIAEARKAVVDQSYFGKYKNQKISSKDYLDTPLYSRRSESKKSSTIQLVRDVLVARFGEDVVSELERQGKLEIIQDYDVEGVEGFYYNGKAVLVASNLTKESAVPTFLHELGGHGGFQNMMSEKQYQELMRQFDKLVEQGNPIAMAAKLLAEREQGTTRQKLEYLPYLLTLSSTMQQRNVIQRNALQKLINNIVAYVKAWAFDRLGINLNLNPDDILALSERMVKQIKHQSSLDLIRQKYQGTSQWMTAPNGANTHLSEQQWLQVRTPEFKKWFGDWENDTKNSSQVLDENGEPKVVYHGTATEFNEFKQGHGLLGDGIYLTDSFDTADMYANIRGNNGFVLPLFVNIRSAFKTSGNVSRDKIVDATRSGKYQGVVHQFDNQEYIVALESNQMKMAEGNTTFNSASADIRFSRSSNYEDITNRIANGFKNLPKAGDLINKAGDLINKKGVDWLSMGLGLLSRRHLTEVYGKLLPQLNKYNELAAQMDADKNDIAADADNIVREWSKLKDEEALANVMHDATLAQIDPAKAYQQGDNKVKYQQLLHAYNNLSPEAKAMYKKARNAYSGHYSKVREAIRERILRSALSSQKKADLLKNIEGSFGQIKGVYFPLARFGQYVVVMRNQNGQAEVISRAETNNEAESIRSELMKKYPQYKADDVKKDAEFSASRDSVGRGFMSDLFDEVGNLGLDKKAQADFEDTLSQLYLSSMPDLSWAKHGIHRKGTAGFSQDARRAFAQHMFSGANYLGKLRYGDQLAQQLDEMKKYSNEQFNKGVGYDQRSAQSVIDEMEKRHELLMNPKGNPISSVLTSVGFMYYMGLSPAAAMVNLSQTALIAYPLMGAKWNYDKAGKELLKASSDFAKGVEFNVPDFSSLESFKNSIGDVYSPNIDKVIKGLELDAYNEAVKRGVIDVTQAHDLAGIAQGEDSKVMWYFRPAMRLASGMFHHAERFNREVTFIAAYRLATKAGATQTEAFEQAMDMVYRGHFDYSTGNRARFMQGNIAKVVLLFKQYAQNMIYTLVRNAHQSIYALDPKDQKEARRALAGILGMHALAAGAIGLPITGMLATASILIAKKSKLGAAAFGITAVAAFASGGDDDDPYKLENVIRNWLSDIHPKFADLVFGGVPRAFSPVDLSGRVGLNNLIFPDVQDGLEGADWAKAMQSALLGPVVGISTNAVKGMQEINNGDYGRGIETMLPVALKNAMKSYRFSNEGVLTKNKDVIQEEVGAVGLFSQAIGFSPSDVKTSMEGRSAIYDYKTKLENHRKDLMRQWVVAKRDDDSEGMDKAWAEILEFNKKTNEKNPSMRIKRINLMQSYKSNERRAKDTGDGGVYLTKRQKGAEEQGGFAFNR
ncbi:PLxRFG domain-containing protein [Acinetobacter sp. ULE_I010]|uniref:PLxRFG domain-containing protein n=1 Tax=Acinetobacter sp. ULE_I010 TaxID=3373065 RepID=UPI003AF42866